MFALFARISGSSKVLLKKVLQNDSVVFFLLKKNEIYFYNLFK